MKATFLGCLTLAIVVSLFGSLALAADAPKSAGKAAAVQPIQNSAGQWHRTVDGRSVWIADKVESAKPARVQPPQTNTARRVNAFRTIVVTTYPNSGPAETINGIEWYLNGRSYFSD